MIIDLKRSIDLRWLVMSGAIPISDDLVFSFEVSPYMCVPVEILVCGNSLWKGSKWYVCASTTWWFLASCCSTGSSEGPTLFMRRSTVWQHPVVISATQLWSTPLNGSPRQPIGIWANHTILKHTLEGQRETISNGLWATDRRHGGGKVDGIIEQWPFS